MSSEDKLLLGLKGETMAAPDPKLIAPKAFISYSWDDDAHKEWVKQLAIRLRNDGVDVTLDRWHAAPGDQIPAFMERAVRENDFVISVCTPRFKERSDGRGGGVGYEGDIMTAYAFTGSNTRKFIPVLRRGSWEEAAPAWLIGRVHIDLSNDPYSESEYKELLDTLHGAREAPPPIRPRFDSGDKQGSQASPAPAPVTPPTECTTTRHQSSVTVSAYLKPESKTPEEPERAWNKSTNILGAILASVVLTSVVAFALYRPSQNPDNQGKASTSGETGGELRKGVESPAKPDTGPRKEPERVMILWRDNDAQNNSKERQKLEDLGYKVDSVTSNEEAIKKIENNTYAVLISNMYRRGNEEDPRELTTSLERFRVPPKVIYYTGKKPGQIPREAFGVAVVPEELFDLVSRAVPRPASVRSMK
jgi:hypothetical protein